MTSGVGARPSVVEGVVQASTSGRASTSGASAWPSALATRGAQEEDMIKTAGSEIARLKEIPVPQSIQAEASQRTHTFELPREYIRAAPPPGVPAGTAYSAIPYSYSNEDRIDWDIDPAGVRFLRELNKGEKGYSVADHGPVSEDLMERVIDSFEKAVKADVLPALATIDSVDELKEAVADPEALLARLDRQSEA